MTTLASYAEVEVCVCTFKRASLTETLISLGEQIMPTGVQLSVLVLDNDAVPSAKETVERFAESTELRTRYVHCPGGNISIARNAALEHSHARYLAFLDDDETASPMWVSNLFGRMHATGADVILGPVRAIYEAKASKWMKLLDIHSTEPVLVAGQYQTGYSCNVLVDQHSPALAGMQFDLSLGRSGGEDTWFFSQVFRRGGRIGYASDAVVYEKVPSARATFSWLATRRFRMGQSHGLSLTARSNMRSRFGGILTATAKIGFCAATAILASLSPARRNGAVLRGCLHAGVLSSHLGMRQIELYGTTEVAQ